MIVEDEVILTMAIRQTLEASGFEVTSPVLSGEDAIARVAAERPDLIIMDVTLQGDLDGVSTTDMIVEKYNIPIIITTAHSDPIMLKRINESKCSNYLLKPINFREIVDLISKTLEHSQKVQYND